MVKLGDAYNFFNMSRRMSLNSHNSSTNDYQINVKNRIPQLKRKLSAQLSRIDDENSKEYLKLQRMIERLENASEVDERKSTPNYTVIKDMDTVVDFIIAENFSYMISVLNNGGMRKQESQIFTNPLEECEKVIKKFEDKAIEQEKQGKVDECKKSLYTKDKLQEMYEAYNLISSADKRVLVDEAILEQEAMHNRDLFNKMKQRKQNEIATVVLAKNGISLTSKDKPITKSSATAEDSIISALKRTNKYAGKCSDTYGGENSRWYAAITRNPKLIFEAVDKFEDNILVYDYGQYIFEAMITEPSAEVPFGKPTMSDENNHILGVTKTDKFGEKKTYMIISPVNELKMKENEDFTKNVYLSDTLLNLAVERNFGYAGDFERKNVPNNLMYNNYQLNYNMPFDYALLTSLQLAMANESELMRAKVFKGYPIGTVCNVIDYYTSGKVIDISRQEDSTMKDYNVYETTPIDKFRSDVKKSINKVPARKMHARTDRGRYRNISKSKYFENSEPGTYNFRSILQRLSEIQVKTVKKHEFENDKSDMKNIRIPGDNE